MTEKNCLGFVLIMTELGAESKVLEEIQRLPEIEYVEQTMGGHLTDLVVKLSTESQDKFKSLITSIRDKIPDIRSTITLLVA